MNRTRQAIVLVGHGGIPTDCPRELVMQLKRLESLRRATGAPPSREELDLDRRIRRWPRTPETDPYRAGLEDLAARWRRRLNGMLFALAYNEYCAPTLEEAVETVVAAGADRVTVVSSMFTPGGSHSEIEIPATLAALRLRYPAVPLRYAWPFDLDLIATMLSGHLERFLESAE
jgi:sirohydrochlorin cobaltochelatase